MWIKVWGRALKAPCLDPYLNPTFRPWIRPQGFRSSGTSYGPLFGILLFSKSFRILKPPDPDLELFHTLYLNWPLSYPNNGSEIKSVSLFFFFSFLLHRLSPPYSRFPNLSYMRLILGLLVIFGSETKTRYYNLKN